MSRLDDSFVGISSRELDITIEPLYLISHLINYLMEYRPTTTAYRNISYITDIGILVRMERDYITYILLSLPHPSITVTLSKFMIR